MLTNRTLIVPVDPKADWSAFTWEAKMPGARLDYTLDFAAWAAMEGLLWQGHAIQVTPDLNVVAVSQGMYLGNTVQLNVELDGGNTGTTAMVKFDITFTTGRVLEVMINLPIIQDRFRVLVPVDAIDIGNITINGQDIIIGGSIIGYRNPPPLLSHDPSITIDGQTITYGSYVVS